MKTLCKFIISALLMVFLSVPAVAADWNTDSLTADDDATAGWSMVGPFHLSVQVTNSVHWQLQRQVAGSWNAVMSSTLNFEGVIDGVPASPVTYRVYIIGGFDTGDAVAVSMGY